MRMNVTKRINIYIVRKETGNIDIKDNENNSAYTVAWKYRSGFVQKTGRSETTGCYADFCKKAGCEGL